MNGYDALTAARDSAYWAGAAALAAWLIGLITLVVNGGGILLLWRQLKISEAAATAASDAVHIAASETRPWLKVSVGGLKGLVGSDGRLRVIGTIVITNVGKTPATNILVGSKVLVQPDAGAIAAAFTELKTEKTGLRAVVFPEEAAESISWNRLVIADDDRGRARDVRLAVLVRYSSKLNKHATPILLDIWPSADESAAIVGWTLVEEGEQPLDSSPAHGHSAVPT